MTDIQREIVKLKTMLKVLRDQRSKLISDTNFRLRDSYWWTGVLQSLFVSLDPAAKHAEKRGAQIHQMMRELQARIKMLEMLEVKQQKLEKKRIAELGGMLPYDEYMKNSDASDKTFQKMVKAIDPRAGKCLVATGKPDRASANLQESQGFYFFDGTTGRAEYDFPKPAEADCMHVFIKAKTEEPRSVKIYVDNRPADTICVRIYAMSEHEMKNSDASDKTLKKMFKGPDFQWVSVGPINCKPGATDFKLKIVPIGFAPHIAAAAVLPFSRPPYEIIPGLDFGGKFDVKTMKADNLDRVQDECLRINCNVFVVCGGNAYLKRVMHGFDGRPVRPPNRSKRCTMYVQKEFASAIRGAVPR